MWPILCIMKPGATGQGNNYPQGHSLNFSFPLKNFILQSEGHKNRASCRLDLFRWWVIPAEAWPILKEMALWATIPRGPPLHYSTFLDPCLDRESVSCSNWIIAPSNLYTAYWMAVAATQHCLPNSVPEASWTHTQWLASGPPRHSPP